MRKFQCISRCHWQSIVIGLFVVAAAAALPAAELRTWTDVTGRFKVEAEFVETKGDVVALKRKDGTRLEIPLARLSEPDKQLVKSLMSSEADDPFKTVSPPAAPAAIRLPAGEVHQPSWDGAIEVSLVAGDRWEIPSSSLPSLDFAPKVAGLPAKIDFFEGQSGFAVSVTGKRAAVSYKLEARARNTKTTSRIVVVDLESGRTLANASLDGSYVVIALHDDGEQIVAEKTEPMGSSSRDKKHTLTTLIAQGNKVSVQDEWIPYSQSDEGSRHVRFSAFANQGKFITCNEPGIVAVWDFATRKLDFHFRISRTSIPALSPDRRHVGYAGGNKVAFINIETQEPVGQKAASGMDFWVKGEFSPSGKRFAASSQQKLMIWDLESGELLFEGNIPGLALAYGLQFPAEDFVLISKEYLVEWTSGIKVWQYTGAGTGICRNGTIFIVSNAVIPMQMPHPDALRLLEQAKAQSDLFIVKKGVSLSLDVSAVPAPYQAEVREALTKQIEKIGCKVSPSAEVSVKASTTGPKKDTVSYFSAGSFQIDRYISTIEFLYRDKKIWSSSQSNVPGALFSPRDKSYQQQIDEAGAKPNLYFFGHANFPAYLQKPTENAGTGTGGQGQQTLGVSKVSS